MAYHKLKNVTGFKIVYIMAGIPDISCRRKNRAIPYEESWFENNDNTKFHEISNKLDTILNLLYSIGCKVVFIPITTMSIDAWNMHRQCFGKTRYLMYQTGYPLMQVQLNDIIHKINNLITQINNDNKMVTPFLHSCVHKCKNYINTL